jgi:excisionase family DNA binding protein
MAKTKLGRPKTTDNDIIISKLNRIEKMLDSQQGFDKEHLSIAETARYLSCHRGMVYQLTKAGKLKQLEVGGKRKYYRTEDVKALFESQTKQNFNLETNAK